MCKIFYLAWFTVIHLTDELLFSVIKIWSQLSPKHLMLFTRKRLEYFILQLLQEFYIFIFFQTLSHLVLGFFWFWFATDP